MANIATQSEEEKISKEGYTANVLDKIQDIFAKIGTHCLHVNVVNFNFRYSPNKKSQRKKYGSGK